jgi:hypothetical protein
MLFAGGMPFKGVWGDVASANLTPDPSGIPYYDEPMFVEVMRKGRNGARKVNPVMPWPYFRDMTDDDLRAIFAFLRTLAPVKHHVDNAEVFSWCPKCRYVHGLGQMNESSKLLAHVREKVPSNAEGIQVGPLHGFLSSP